MRVNETLIDGIYCFQKLCRGDLEEVGDQSLKRCAWRTHPSFQLKRI